MRLVAALIVAMCFSVGAAAQTASPPQCQLHRYVSLAVTTAEDGTLVAPVTINGTVLQFRIDAFGNSSIAQHAADALHLARTPSDAQQGQPEKAAIPLLSLSGSGQRMDLKDMAFPLADMNRHGRCWQRMCCSHSIWISISRTTSSRNAATGYLFPALLRAFGRNCCNRYRCRRDFQNRIQKCGDRIPISRITERVCRSTASNSVSSSPYLTALPLHPVHQQTFKWLFYPFSKPIHINVPSN